MPKNIFFKVSGQTADKSNMKAFCCFQLFFAFFLAMFFNQPPAAAQPEWGEAETEELTSGGSRRPSFTAPQGRARGAQSGQRELGELKDLLRCDNYGGYGAGIESAVTAGCKRRSAVDEACPGAMENIFNQYRALVSMERRFDHIQDVSQSRQLNASLKSHQRAIYQSLCVCKGDIEGQYAELRQKIDLPELKRSYKELKIDKFIQTHREDQSKRHIVSLAEEAQRQFDLLKNEHNQCFDINTGPHGSWPPESGSYSACRPNSPVVGRFKQTAGYAAGCVSLDGIHAAYLKALGDYDEEQNRMTRSGQLSQCDKSKRADKLKEWLRSDGPNLGLFEICGKGFSDGFSCCGSLDCKADRELSAKLNNSLNRSGNFQKACGGSSAAYQEVLNEAAQAQREICYDAEKICSKKCSAELNKFQAEFKEYFVSDDIDQFLSEAGRAGNNQAADDCQISALKVRDLYLKELWKFHKKQAEAAEKLPGLSPRERGDLQRFHSRSQNANWSLSEKSKITDIIDCSLIGQEIRALANSARASPAQANPAQANPAPANLASAVQRICRERYGASQYPNQYPGQNTGQYSGQNSGQPSSQHSGQNPSSSSYGGYPRAGSAAPSSNTGSQPSSALAGAASDKPRFVQPEFQGSLSSPDLSKKGLFPNSKNRGPSSDSAGGGLSDAGDFAGGSFSGGDDGSGAFAGAGADTAEAASLGDMESAEDDEILTSEEEIVTSRLKQLQLKAKSVGAGFLRKARKLFRLDKRKRKRLKSRAPDLKFDFGSGAADSKARSPASLIKPPPPRRAGQSIFDRNSELIYHLCKKQVLDCQE